MRSVEGLEREEIVPFRHTYAEPLSGLRVSWGSVLAGAVAMVAVALILGSLAVGIISLAAHPTASSVRSSALALWVCGMATTLVGALVGGYLAGYLPGSTRPGIVAAHGFLAWCVALLISFAFALYLVRGAATIAAAAGTAGVYEQSSATEQGGAAQGASLPADSLSGVAWSWFGTWAAALGLAIGGAALGARRLRAGSPPTP